MGLPDPVLPYSAPPAGRPRQAGGAGLPRAGLADRGGRRQAPVRRERRGSASVRGSAGWRPGARHASPTVIVAVGTPAAQDTDMVTEFVRPSKVACAVAAGPLATRPTS